MRIRMRVVTVEDVKWEGRDGTKPARRVIWKSVEGLTEMEAVICDPSIEIEPNALMDLDITPID